MSDSVTRADVAQLAGTSTAVVSYVINNGPRNVSPTTRERVLAAIDELGYRPNVVARALRSSETNTYGLIVPNISNPYFAELAHALESRAMAAGKLLLLGSAEESGENERAYIRNFLERRVDGVIVVGVTSTSALEVIGDAGTRIVVLDRPLDDPTLPIVSIDHESAAYAATRHLVEHGHRVVACVAGPDDQSVASDRVQGWRRALVDAGLEATPHLVVRGEFSLAGGLSAGERLLALSDRPPTAAFVSSDQQALGLLSALERAGRRVPDDLAVFSFDGTAQSAFTVPALSVVQQPFDQMADAAIGLLTGPDNPGPVARLGFDLVPRRSCGCHGTVSGTTGEVDGESGAAASPRTARLA